uniref:Uncharacterized protein n=1 Tax=Phaselicystis flava TaxID=525924 RepID=A0A3S5GYI3_9BACT|nr:hypothetical protein [Phaselicystis flava]
MKNNAFHILLAALLAPVAIPGCGAGDPLETAAPDSTTEDIGTSSAAVTANAVLRRSTALDGTTNHKHEICRLDVDWLNQSLDLNLAAGNQIRIRKSGGTAAQKGVCTIEDNDGARNVVRMGNMGFRRIEMEAPPDQTTETTIILDSNVTSTSSTYGIGEDGEEAADDDQEFFDAVKETSNTQTEVVVIAPHGGDMEPGTDEQANTHFYNQLPSDKVTSWQANGYNDTVQNVDVINASHHWHITATHITSATGFQHLAGVIGRDFKYPVAFHGYASTRPNGVIFHPNEVLVGGRESPLFRQEIAEMITLATRNPITRVAAITGNWQTLDDLDGDEEENIVNELGTTNKGLQLEQSTEARGPQWRGRLLGRDRQGGRHGLPLPRRFPARHPRPLDRRHDQGGPRRSRRDLRSSPRRRDPPFDRDLAIRSLRPRPPGRPGPPDPDAVRAVRGVREHLPGGRRALGAAVRRPPQNRLGQLVLQAPPVPRRPPRHPARLRDGQIPNHRQGGLRREPVRHDPAAGGGARGARPVTAPRPHLRRD